MHSHLRESKCSGSGSSRSSHMKQKATGPQGPNFAIFGKKKASSSTRAHFDSLKLSPPLASAWLLFLVAVSEDSRWFQQFMKRKTNIQYQSRSETSRGGNKHASLPTSPCLQHCRKRARRLNTKVSFFFTDVSNLSFLKNYLGSIFIYSYSYSQCIERFSAFPSDQKPVQTPLEPVQTPLKPVQMPHEPVQTHFSNGRCYNEDCCHNSNTIQTSLCFQWPNRSKPLYKTTTHASMAEISGTSAGEEKHSVEHSWAVGRIAHLISNQLGKR